MSSVQYFENDNTTFLCCTYEIYTNNQIAERFCQNLKERVSSLKVKKDNAPIIQSSIFQIFYLGVYFPNKWKLEYYQTM